MPAADRAGCHFKNRFTGPDFKIAIDRALLHVTNKRNAIFGVAAGPAVNRLILLLRFICNTSYTGFFYIL
jgi:hypothetical protein